MKLNKVTLNDAKSILSNDRIFAKFLKENSNFLNKLVHKHVSNNRLNYNDNELFQDVYQEACLSLWKKALPNYNGTTKFSTFCYTVLRNDIIEFLQKRSKFESINGPNISIEHPKLMRNSDTNGLVPEYNEKLWKSQKKRHFEEEIDERIYEEEQLSKLSPVDLKVLDMKRKGVKRQKIAEALGLNLHTYKAYYYGTFVEKMKKYGMKYEEL